MTLNDYEIIKLLYDNTENGLIKWNIILTERNDLVSRCIVDGIFISYIINNEYGYDKDYIYFYDDKNKYDYYLHITQYTGDKIRDIHWKFSKLIKWGNNIKLSTLKGLLEKEGKDDNRD